MRLSRPCYDKPHRCPGWAGGGMKYAKTERCHGGHVTARSPWWFGRCDTCGVVTWPWVWAWPGRAWSRRRTR